LEDGRWAELVAAEWEIMVMGKYRASFLRRDQWWVGWTDDVPGALTQGATLEEARENLRDAIRLMQKPAPAEELPEPSASELINEVIEA
jgi:predicted RNase H-like HicB family nuclease